MRLRNSIERGVKFTIASFLSFFFSFHLVYFFKKRNCTSSKLVKHSDSLTEVIEDDSGFNNMSLSISFY